ncbi:MAG: histidinol-phosphate transaminase [Sphaerochaeta sp.]|jgi:histidinol-phosphate aminotransferase|nr:histidinol-phosphate transaminase [Sphaerochaeta sp.]MDX9914693.1 histidinol-phosphate transaminase [Sphaerochaeta sp.]
MIKNLIRTNIANLTPYSSARNEFTGEAEVYLDANENWQGFVSFENANRYPDPQATALRRRIEEVLGLPFAHTVIGSGSDELIDNLIRIFCEPGRDSILVMNPTYGAYRVFADINDVAVHSVDLLPDFQIDRGALTQFLEDERRERESGRLKVLFICSPNNPTANAFALEEIAHICTLFDGIVVVDEAYQDFSTKESSATLVGRYENVVVLRTLSKCWGLASARVGIAVASEQIVALIAAMKYPYNVGGPSQALALEALGKGEEVRAGLAAIIRERERLQAVLPQIACIRCVYPSDANFLLVRVDDERALYRFLAERGIIVRDRSTQTHCAGCLRFTVGSSEENERLLAALKEYSNG